MGRRSETSLQRKHKDGQRAYEKMVNTINYQRNANQNYNEYHLTPVKITIITRGGMGVGWERWGGVGGRLKREGIYVYLWLILIVVTTKLTQHCKQLSSN